MKKIIIKIGISGSGKTTHSQHIIKQDKSYLRINRDDIRKTLVGNLDGYYQRDDISTLEMLITELEDSYFYSITNNNKNVIVDNTNLTPKYIQRWIDKINYLKEYKDYSIEFHIHDIDIKKAKSRVLRRDFDIMSSDFIDSEYEEVKYIDKQYSQFNEIKKYIEENFDKNIIKYL